MSKQVGPSLGERRLQIEFQSGNNDEIQNCKEQYARRINELELNRTDLGHDPADSSEFNRYISLAQTLVQQACNAHVDAIELHRNFMHGK